MLIICRITSPKLNSVLGAFNIQSSENITESCAFYKPLQTKKFIKGKYVCEGKLANPDVAGTSPTKQSGDKTGAATTLSAMNGALGLAAMVAVVLL
jgi:hypothetical protein